MNHGVAGREDDEAAGASSVLEFAAGLDEEHTVM
jgi:hypothetical protein